MHIVRPLNDFDWGYKKYNRISSSPVILLGDGAQAGAGGLLLPGGGECWLFVVGRQPLLDVVGLAVLGVGAHWLEILLLTEEYSIC